MGSLEKVYQSFLIGLPFDIEIHTRIMSFLLIKKLAEEIKRVNLIRDSHKKLFVDGIFKDDVGLDIDDKNIVVKLFDGVILLTLWNKSN